MMVKRPALPIYHPASLLATWFGCGLIVIAPGTWGSLGALLCGWFLVKFGSLAVLLSVAFLAFLAGLWSTRCYVAALGQNQDPGEVVIDEVVGQWIAMAPIALSPLKTYLIPYVAAFVLFRLFDIWKPWPVGLLDRNLKGALGVMMDDVAAGIYAAVICLLLFGAGSYEGLWQAAFLP